MSRFIQDLRFGLRTFVKTPGFTAVAVVVLGLGIGANTAMFTIVNALVFQSLSGDADDLVGVFSRDRTRPDSYRAFSYPNYIDIRDRSGVFDGLLAHTFSMAAVPAGDTARRTFVSVVSSDYFDTFGVRLAAGRTFSAEEEKPGARIPVVVMNHSQWKRTGFDPAFIGSTIRINAEDFTVVGVAPEGFTGTMAIVAPEMWLPLGMFDTVVNDIFKNKGTGLADRSNTGLFLAGRLKPGLGDAAVAARLDALSRQLEAEYPAENKNQELSVRPLARVSTSTSPQTNQPLAILTGLLLALSGVVLLIACLNIANMMLARGAVRTREVAIRLAVGAQRSRVVRQLLTEGLALAVTGGAAGLAIGYWATRSLAVSLASVLPLALTFDPRPDANVMAATTSLAAISTVLFGLGPALRLSRRDLVTDLKDGAAHRSSPRRWLSARNVLVVSQIALSLGLLTAGGVFARTALKASAADPGYRYDRLLVASIDPALGGMDEPRGRAAYREVLARIRRLPGVESAAITSSLPFGNFHEGRPVEALGDAAATQAPSPELRIIGSDYFKSVGLSLMRGREFTPAEEEASGGPRTVIIDEALARALFGAADPLGRQIRFVQRPGADSVSADSAPMEIVGVAPPIREELLERAPSPHFYVPAGRFYRGNMHVQARVARGADDGAMLAAMRREIRQASPALPVLELTTMSGFHEKGLELWVLKAGGRIFTVLGVIALLLAVVGVYGVKSYVVSQRTREIGIRIALGADRRNVLWLVLRDGLILTAVGLACGLPLAVLASFALQAVFVDLPGFDLLVYTAAPAVLALTAVAACVLPARRATRIMPLVALRME